MIRRTQWGPGAVLALLLGALCLPVRGEAAEPPGVHLARAQAFSRAGSLEQAQQHLEQVMASEEGQDLAEAWITLFEVRLEGGDAFGAREALQAAQRRRALSSGWNAGEDGVLDNVIAGRLRWFERNFGTVRLQWPFGATPLPPLADPPPPDPLLRRVAGALDRILLRSTQADATSIDVLLPHGQYWVEGSLRQVAAPEAAAAVEVWSLARPTADRRRAWQERVDGIADGEFSSEQPNVAVEPADEAAERFVVGGRVGALGIFRGGDTSLPGISASVALGGERRIHASTGAEGSLALLGLVGASGLGRESISVHRVYGGIELSLLRRNTGESGPLAGFVCRVRLGGGRNTAGSVYSALPTPGSVIVFDVHPAFRVGGTARLVDGGRIDVGVDVGGGYSGHYGLGGGGAVHAGAAFGALAITIRPPLPSASSTKP